VTARLLRILAVACALAGCMRGPEVPKVGSPDAYGWRAPIDVVGNEPAYRFDIAPELEKWLGEQDIRGIAIFDATGTPQACGGFSNGPLESKITHSQGRVAEFAADACTPHGDPAVCFRGRGCDIADYCPHIEIDLSRSATLAGIDALPDLLAVANAAPDACDLTRETPCTEVGLNDEIHAQQRQARREARSALARVQLDALLKPDPPPPPRTKPGQFNPGSGAMGGGVRGRLGGAMLSGPGASGASQPNYGPIPLTPVGTPAIRSPQSKTGDAAAEATGGYVVEFDEPATEIRLYWSPPTGGQVGTTTLIAYDAEGHLHTHTDYLQPFGGNMADRFEQVVWIDTHPRSLRVIAQSSIPDLRLVGATSTKREHKPFVDAHKRQYWFAPSGHAPYGLYLEHGQGTCAYGEDARQTAAYPRINEPDWPPAATIGAPIRNPRSAFAALASSRFGVVVWGYWLGVMLALWCAGAALVGVRWWVLRSTRLQRRS